MSTEKILWHDYCAAKSMDTKCPKTWLKRQQKYFIRGWFESLDPKRGDIQDRTGGKEAESTSSSRNCQMEETLLMMLRSLSGNSLSAPQTVTFSLSCSKHQTLCLQFMIPVFSQRTILNRQISWCTHLERRVVGRLIEFKQFFGREGSSRWGIDVNHFRILVSVTWISCPSSLGR